MHQNFISINDEVITKYNQKITAHSYTHNIRVRCLGSSRSMIHLRVPTGFNWPSAGATLTGESREVPMTVAVVEASGIDGAREAKTSTDPWQCGGPQPERVPPWFALYPIIVPISVLHKLEDFDLICRLAMSSFACLSISSLSVSAYCNSCRWPFLNLWF